MNDRAANKQLSFDQLDSGVAPVADPASVPMPHYTVRVSPRARRLQLKVSPLGKEEVVAPHRVAAKDVHVLVERHGQWLQRTLARLSAERARYHAEEGGLPTRIALRALDETWTEQRVEGGARVAVMVGADSVLCLRGGDEALRVRALRRWLQRHALTTLASLLRETSIATDLPYTALSVRAQRSRWGSCASGGNISLNRNLLFLPPALVCYVMIHELCLTRHMNLGGRGGRRGRRRAAGGRGRGRGGRRGGRDI